MQIALPSLDGVNKALNDDSGTVNILGTTCCHGDSLMSNCCSSLLWVLKHVFSVCLPCSIIGIQCCSMPSEVMRVLDNNRACTRPRVGNNFSSNCVNDSGNVLRTNGIFAKPLKDSCAESETGSGFWPAACILNGHALVSEGRVGRG